MLSSQIGFALRLTALLALCGGSCQATANDLLNNMLQQAIGHAITRGIQNAGNTPPPIGPSSSHPSSPPPSSTVEHDQTVSLDSARDFSPNNINRAWRQPDTVGVAPGAGGAVRGHVEAKTSYGGNAESPGVVSMRKKLDALYGMLLKQPPLMSPQGISVVPGGGFANPRPGATTKAVVGGLVVRAYPIKPDHMTTQSYPDGTFHTPGEGCSLNVLVNDTYSLRSSRLLGIYNGMTLFQRGGGYQLVVLNTPRPLLVNGVLNRDLIDPSRPASDIQVLVISVRAPSSTWSELERGQLHPASGAGRLLGVMFSADWRGLLRQIEFPQGKAS
ncbi:hypothetical protein [Hydrogenophaga sp.]|uniref:hypothetical protein n=1 Tax=Hydrogenophaga sp. TaxID=1904254 RepID=UPI002FC8D5FE